MHALVTGATGFVGRRLLQRLERPVVLSRGAEQTRKRLDPLVGDVYAWRPHEEPAPVEAFDDVEVVFHLAGEPVAEGRWTAAKRERIRESRVVGTRNLVQALSSLGRKPKLLVSASAVGYYGSRSDELLTEATEPRDDFLAETCVAWEAEAAKARGLGIRVVTVRVGIVLGRGGGALAKMLTPFKLGLGSPLGSGWQWMPWIHIDDLVGIMLHAARHSQLDGPMNGTAPNPVTNRQFTRSLGRVLGRPTFLPPVPGVVLRVMMGQFGSVLLTSQRVIPQAALDGGYEFQYAELEAALVAILRPTPPRAA